MVGLFSWAPTRAEMWKYNANYSIQRARCALDFLAAVLFAVTQRLWGGVLRDGKQNGCARGRLLRIRHASRIHSSPRGGGTHDEPKERLRIGGYGERA